MLELLKFVQSMKEFFTRIFDFLIAFIQPKLKFAATSALVTALDYFFYLFLFYYFFPPVIANIISYSILMALNFVLQKKYVFTLNGKVSDAFMKSMLFSLFGLILSTGLIALLNRWIFFFNYQYITKVLVTGVVFFYNFYTKRFSFEGK